MKTILIVGAGPLQVPAFRAAKAKGLRIITIDKNSAAPGMGLADAAYAVDPRDNERAVKIATEEQVNGVLTLCTDAPLRTVAAVCRALDLPGLAPDVAMRATHKGQMRDALAKKGVPIPHYRRVFDADEARAAAAELGLPVIIKPVASSGSQGVHAVASSADIEAALAHAGEYAHGASEVLVEELVDGPEVSVETLSYQGQHHVVAITDKRTSGDPYWVELGHVQPSRLPRVAQTQIRVATLAALDALGLMDCAAHVEMKVSRKGPRIIEIAARLGGDYITTELVPRSTGIDMVGAAIDLALGEVPRAKATRYGAAAVCYVTAPRGQVVRVEGVDAAKARPGVVGVELFVTPGDFVGPVRASQDRAACVTAEADDPAEAERRAQAGAAAIRIDTTGEGG